MKELPLLDVDRFTGHSGSHEEVRLSTEEGWDLEDVDYLADLTSLLPYHLNVMRFIEDQISNDPKVDLRRKKTEECHAILAGAGYNKVEDKFDYLMRLPVSTFTAESIEKNQRKLDELRTEIQRLERCSPAEMWLTELSGV